MKKFINKNQNLTKKWKIDKTQKFMNLTQNQNSTKNQKLTTKNQH